MTGFFDGYRKAKKDDIACNECAHSAIPAFPYKRLRCTDYQGNDYAVGKSMTCDNATRKGDVNHEST